MDANQGNRKAVLLVFVLFALGIALGSVGTYVVTTRVLAARPQATLAHAPGHMEMFTRDLNLNPDQQNQIQATSMTRALDTRNCTKNSTLNTNRSAMRAGSVFVKF